MASQAWRSQLIEALHRQHLPRRYIERLVEELSDHADDLFLESPNMDVQPHNDARLGTAEQLAQTAKLHFRRSTFAGRHPVVTFVAGPLMSMVAALIGTVLLLVAVVWLVDCVTGGVLSKNDGTGLPPSPFEMTLMQVMNCIVRFVPFAWSTWCFVRLGRHSGLSRWSIASCGIVAATAILFYSEMSNDGTGGRWMMGFGWRGWKIDAVQLAQSVIPMAVAVAMLWRCADGRSETLATEA
ncbi:MAG TPA: hypothetical protein VG713_09360 [Pirellulales bacterium]|nr:hypothetical protein [Pirellulales bacterium]